MTIPPFDERGTEGEVRWRALFPAEADADPYGTRFLDFFQQDKLTGQPKGIVSVDLNELT